jgi:glycosyltransferase involved in cell wall biosynthesis
VQRSAFEVAKGLARLDSDIRFISPGNVMHRRLAKELCAFTCGRYSGHFWEQVELLRYLRQNEEPLLVNLANTAPLFYKNQIVTLHDIAFLKNSAWFSKKFYYFYRYLVPKIAKRALKIITPSEFSKREIIKYLHIPDHKIEVVHNSIPYEFNRLAQRNYARQDSDYLLTVGSIDPRKNLRKLISAFRSLESGKFKLFVVGSDSRIFSNENLRELVGEDKKIIFTGYVSDEELVGLYKNARLFVYVSLYEGFGFPPLEAMACGCPVLVSNSASFPEVCGDAAYYVNPYDEQDIARGIDHMLRNEKLREELIRKGLERQILFCGKSSARKLLRIIEDVA